MNTIVREKGGYNFLEGLERAKTRLAYYEEGLFIDVAARVIDAMETSGMTRSELARRMKVSPAYITKILRGHANLSLESLAKVAFALDLKWACILIPKTQTMGLFSLTDEDGSASIRTVETATIKQWKSTPAQDEDAYVDGVQTKGICHELRIPA